MGITWHEYLKAEGTPPEWPYPIKFGEETEETDVLVLGGGIAGCWAAISAARNGVKVALLEKGDVRRSAPAGRDATTGAMFLQILCRELTDEWAIEEMNSSAATAMVLLPDPVQRRL